MFNLLISKITNSSFLPLSIESVCSILQNIHVISRVFIDKSPNLVEFAPSFLVQIILSVAKYTTLFSIPYFQTKSYSIALVMPVIVLAITDELLLLLN